MRLKSLFIHLHGDAFISPRAGMSCGITCVSPPSPSLGIQEKFLMESELICSLPSGRLHQRARWSLGARAHIPSHLLPLTLQDLFHEGPAVPLQPLLLLGPSHQAQMLTHLSLKITPAASHELDCHVSEKNCLYLLSPQSSTHCNLASISTPLRQFWQKLPACT